MIRLNGKIEINVSKKSQVLQKVKSRLSFKLPELYNLVFQQEVTFIFVNISVLLHKQ